MRNNMILLNVMAYNDIDMEVLDRAALLIKLEIQWMSII